LNHVISRFFRGLGFARHVVADVILHQLTHQAVDRSPGGGEALKHVRARRIFFQGALDGFQLAHNLLGAIEEI
jgi:hypothetical protein